MTRLRRTRSAALLACLLAPAALSAQPARADVARARERISVPADTAALNAASAGAATPSASARARTRPAALAATASADDAGTSTPRDADAPAASTAADGGTAAAPAKNTAFFLSAGPLLLVNTDSGTNSAPSPVVFSLGAGADFFRNGAVTVEPRLSFFTTYYLWDGEDAHPAEIENRTALVLAALLDLRAFKAWQRGANRFMLGGGAGFLARQAVLANGVASGDAGGEKDRDGSATSTAGDDVASISSYLWQSARFLYPELVFSWMHALPAAASAGLEAAFYVPLGSLASGNGLDAALLALSFKLEF